MIKTSQQLKALIRNMSNGDSTRAQILIRNYAMERFLERMSLSAYRDNLILKGGMLVASMVGLSTRSTMDIDTTIKNIPLSLETAKEMIETIIEIPLNDGMTFTTPILDTIMDEAEYNGIRVSFEAKLEAMAIPLKLDISTGDRLTPKEIEYSFNLMFEDRKISILAYNLETVLAEKIETVLARGVINTRMRDYYDLYILQSKYMKTVDVKKLVAAVVATSDNRNTKLQLYEGETILKEISENSDMQKLWNKYQKKYSYAADIAWNMILAEIYTLYEPINASLKLTSMLAQGEREGNEKGWLTPDEVEAELTQK